MRVKKKSLYRPFKSYKSDICIRETDLTLDKVKK